MGVVQQLVELYYVAANKGFVRQAGLDLDVDPKVEKVAGRHLK